MFLNKLIAPIFIWTSLFAASAMAQNDYQMSCKADITSNIIFANNQLIVKSTKQEDILFEADGTVLVNGRQIALTKEEKKLTQRYYKDVEDSIPIVVDISLAALKITSMAVTEVFTGLLGKDSELPQKLNTRINEVANAVKEHVYQDPNSLTFNSAYLKDDLGIGNELDQEIEALKEELISSMMGQFIIAIGKSILDGDGNFAELETRMNDIGKDIEKRAEALAKGLKEKSLGLCDKIKRLDKTEVELRKIDALRYLNTIDFNKDA
jgi:hypothetical protein